MIHYKSDVDKEASLGAIHAEEAIRPEKEALKAKLEVAR